MTLAYELKVTIQSLEEDRQGGGGEVGVDSAIKLINDGGLDRGRNNGGGGSGWIFDILKS